MTHPQPLSAPERRASPGAEAFEADLLENLCFQLGTTLQSTGPRDAYRVLAVTVRDRLAARRARTAAAHLAANPRFVYYLSAEYMLGRQLAQNLLYSGTEQAAREALARLGLSLPDIAGRDLEPGLGNGGLGRLAACLVESLATLDVPCVGYGIRYEFGIFKQTFVDGAQVERPDDWAFHGNPWEFPAPDDRQLVGFRGHTEPVDDDPTGLRRRWVPAETVRGEPSHMLVPGYGTDTVNIVRLWQARAARESFDLARFASGEYGEAVEEIVRSQNISKVLYPDDSTEMGRELRLRQQYFLVACSLRDIIRRFRFRNTDWDDFPAKVVIQINDTHPALAVPELMRILVDEERLGWDHAWDITRRTFAYTCHTLLPEALETWPSRLLGRLLPRHLEIIQVINLDLLQDVAHRCPGDSARLARMSLFQEGDEQRVRMAHLAVVGGSAVNGVAELHSRLLASTTFADFAGLWPERFRNVTNGVSPRRFLRLANPRLSALLDEVLGEGWLTDLDRLEGLVPLADDAAFRERWRAVKQAAQRDLARHVRDTTSGTVLPDSLHDVMIKRFHEYKRQILKILHVVTLYQRLRDGRADDAGPRTVVFGGKGAPGYHAVKRIIQLINAVAATVNADPAVAGRLAVVFIPDYNVTRAELIVPAADLSEQISMAGKEASGTGNMKLALNGALTIGTLDGANIEIRDRVGAENFFLFGLDAADAADLRDGDYRPRTWYERDAELRDAIDAIADGAFSGGDRELFAPVVASLLDRDEYLALADYRSYLECQDAVERAWQDPDGWTRRSILNTARCGWFSSDRTVRDYVRDIWHVDALSPGRVP